MTRAELKARAKAQLGSSIFGNNWLMALLACLVYTAILSAASAIVPGIGGVIVLGSLSFGITAIFLKQARDGNTINFGDLFGGFTSDFGGTFLLGLMQGIFVFLWSLLFVIPGIVKTYSYAMSYYIKADHPEYDWKTCIDESRRMMDGHKAELFVLDLSFIGWYIVGSLCLGLGTLWVAPYHFATRAQFYNALAQNIDTVSE